MRALISLVALSLAAHAGPFAPAAGQPGTTAISFDDPLIVGWATGVFNLTRGLTDISDPFGVPASWGAGSDALGIADAMDDSLPVVSLGDGGSITLGFAQPIANGAGPDFAVFENSFTDGFLELGFVEVSSNGVNFFRFPALSLTPAATQLGSFGLLDPTNLHNLAGKYRRGFGTPFDLADLPSAPGLDIGAITRIRIVDVVGSIEEAYRTLDSLGNTVNDPWPTDFETGGFDLDAVAVLHLAVPEPAACALLLAGGALILRRRRK